MSMSINEDEARSNRGSSIKLDRLRSLNGQDPEEMDEDEKKVLFWVKLIHFLNFALFSAIYGTFAFFFWRIMNVDRPQCIAPKEDYLQGFRE